MQEKRSKTNQSVEKILQIIEVLASHPEPMRLHDIAAMVSMPDATVLRMLNTLQIHGYINQDAQNARYYPSLKFAWLGEQISANVNLSRIAHPFLVELAAAAHESCCLAVEENHQLVYLDVVDGPDHMLRITQRIGKRAPLHSTGIGKLLMLNYSPQELDEYIKLTDLAPVTPNTICTREALIAHLATVRKNGYAIDAEECELGAHCLACPIIGYNGKIVAGVSISYPVVRRKPERVQTMLPLLKETTSKLSSLLAAP